MARKAEADVISIDVNQLQFFEGEAVDRIVSVFSGTLNDVENGSEYMQYGDTVTLTVVCRVRQITHAMDKDESTVRRQRLLVDKIVSVG